MKKTLLLLTSCCLSFLLQAQVVSKTLNCTAGKLTTLLTKNEKKWITNLTLSGNIDARDFVTMRDSMPYLAVLDLSSTSIVACTYLTQSYTANTIPQLAFCKSSKTALKSIKLPNSTTSINDWAFSGCTGLSGDLVIPNSVVRIGDYSFNSTNFNSIIIPSSTKYIGQCAFYSDTNLTSINIPSSVDSIISAALSNCKKLTSITIPSSLKYLGVGVLAGCTNLRSIYAGSLIPNELNSTDVGPEVFENVNKKTCTLYVQLGNISAYRNASQWQDFENIVEVSSPEICGAIAKPIILGDTVVEVNTLNVPYTLFSKDTTASYSWKVSGNNNIYASNNAKFSQQIDWNTIGNDTIVVTETTTDGCIVTGSLNVRVKNLKPAFVIEKMSYQGKYWGYKFNDRTNLLSNVDYKVKAGDVITLRIKGTADYAITNLKAVIYDYGYPFWTLISDSINVGAVTAGTAFDYTVKIPLKLSTFTPNQTLFLSGFSADAVKDSINSDNIVTLKLSEFSVSIDSSRNDSTTKYNVLIDNMEDTDTINNLGGSWYAFKSGYGIVIPYSSDTLKFKMTKDSDIRRNYVAKISYKGTNLYDPINNVGLGTSFVADQSKTINVSKSKGITFYYKGDSSEFRLFASVVNDGNYFFKAIPVCNNWTRINVLWTEMKPQYWWYGIQKKDLDLTTINGVEWFLGTFKDHLSQYSIAVDSLAFIMSNQNDTIYQSDTITQKIPFNPYWGETPNYNFLTAASKVVPYNYKAQPGDIISVNITGISNYNVSKFQAAFVDMRPEARPNAYWSELSEIQDIGSIAKGDTFSYHLQIPIKVAAAGYGSYFNNLVLIANSKDAILDSANNGKSITLTLSNFTISIDSSQRGVSTVSEITLNKKSLILQKSYHDSLKIVSYYPQNAKIKSLTWISSNPSAVSVDSSTGAITAIRTGYAIITCNADYVKATCAVYVTDTTSLSTASFLIDDMEDNNNTNNLGGAWGTFNDEKSIINPAQSSVFTMTTDGSNRFAQINYTMGLDTTIGTSWLGMFTSLIDLNNPISDFTGTSGVSFYYKGESSDFQASTSSLNSTNYYFVTIPQCSTWTKFTINWTDLTEVSWDATPRTFDLTHLSNLGWEVTKMNKTTQKGSVAVDELAFQGTPNGVFPSIQFSQRAIAINKYHTDDVNSYVTKKMVKTVGYKIINPSVATISENGIITALQAGTTPIIAYSLEDTTITDTAFITVVAVQEIAFVLPRFVIFENETINMSKCVQTLNGVTTRFEIANSKTATIQNDGSLTGIKYGSTTLFAINTNNSLQKDSTTILVLPDIKINGLSISNSGTQIELKVNGDYQLYSGIENDFNITGTLKAESNYKVKRVMKKVGSPNVLILELESPVSSNQTISVNYAPVDATTGTPKVHSKFTVALSTGVETVEMETKLFPNPAQSTIVIEANELQTVTIYNMQGQALIKELAMDESLTLSIESLSEGIYVAEIITKSQNVKKSFMKR